MTGIVLAACEVAPPADQPWWVGPAAGLAVLLLIAFVVWRFLG